MGRGGESWVSDELEQALAQLSAQQARGVLRIVQAELEGRSLSSLLDCTDQICTSTTYYGSGKKKGWRHKPTFNQALELARRDYRAWMLQYGVEDALTILAGTAPEAARALRQQVVGDQAAVAALVSVLEDEDPELRRSAAATIGLTGLAAAVPHLRAALASEENSMVRGALVEALGIIAGLRDSDRRAAATGVLDRADVKTATKETRSHEGQLDYVDVTEAELAAIRDALRQEAEGGGEAG